MISTAVAEKPTGDIANVIAGLGAITDEQVIANARLIASAPDMLQEIERLRAELAAALAAAGVEEMVRAAAFDGWCSGFCSTGRDEERAEDVDTIVSRVMGRE